MAEKQNLLDILTKADRPTFTVDGERCEMRDPGELSMLEFQRLGQLGAKLQAAGTAVSGDDPDAAFDSLIGTINDLLDLVAPDMPQPVRDKLNPFHVMQIVEAFTGLVRTDVKPGEPQSRKKSSHASRASTPARRRRTG